MLGAWFIFFFAAGFIDEFLIIAYYQALQERESVRAAVASFTHGMVYWVLWVWIVAGFVGHDKTLSLVEALALNLGAAVGTLVVVRKKDEI